MHSFRSIPVFLLLLMMAAISACDGGGEQRNVMSNPAVEALAGDLLEAIKAQDFERLTDVYHESFFKTRSPQAWADELRAFLAERGPMQAYMLRKSQADTRFSGKFYILEYETVHDGNKRLHHLLTIVSPVEGGGLRLVGHKITPWQRENG